MYTHHRFDHEFPVDTPVRVAYLVCATPRTGSSLLCELLLLSGAAGAPTEYFDEAQVAGFRAAWGDVAEDGYLAELQRRKTGPNGILGLKAHAGQLREHGWGDALVGTFDPLLVVWVRRRDRVAQAVSYAIAEQTGAWASTHDTTGPARYSARAIRRCLREIDVGERWWRGWFDRHGLEPLVLEYEAIEADPQSAVAAVLAHLGEAGDLAPDRRQATLERQADARNEDWIARFRRWHPLAAGRADRRGRG